MYDVPFKALFDTGAARSLLHENVKKIVSEQINSSDILGCLPGHKLIYIKSDVDIYDIHN
jgi:hypothetical protein